ncbi:MAG: DUF2240 domain-containing protein [Candidatus Methanoperedenaceae archaeon HGW-Methanoperedenaceae-1]|jgi:hypothetical protein|nr:MAG: DUF2240 domain-containing protein [Candidatus Methanoperedenaceae archaeon HGW-Methanoperedenaceae-1]
MQAMSDLLYTVSMPFRRKGKDVLKESEFILALSIDLKWFPPDLAKTVLAQAEKEGLIKKEGDNVSPAFDVSSVKIPSGFKPDPGIFEEKSLFDRAIEKIMLGTGMEKRNVIALINKKNEELSKMVEIEVSAILVAIEQQVEADDLIDEEYSALINPSSSQ